MLRVLNLSDECPARSHQASYEAPETTEAPRFPHAYPLLENDGNTNCASSIRTEISMTPNKANEALLTYDFKNGRLFISEAVEGAKLREVGETEAADG